MNKLSEWLVKLVIVAILPISFCFGYYAHESLSTDVLLIRVLVITALPLLLLGAGGLVWGYSERGIKRLNPVWWLCVAVAVASLVWVWG